MFSEYFYSFRFAVENWIIITAEHKYCDPIPYGFYLSNLCQ